jgi:hypothetical protein
MENCTGILDNTVGLGVATMKGRTVCRLPNGPGRLASFGAPNDGPVRGMHFGGLVRPGTESEYLGPDIDDCSFRIRF